MSLPIAPEMIAPCGMNCALCRAYQETRLALRKKGFSRAHACTGCIPRGEHCLHMAAVCDTVGKGRVRFCYECAQFPCARLKRLDKRYRTKYHMSMIENLRAIQAKGLEAFVKQQEKQWSCPACGEQLICCHNGLCMRCELDVLKANRRYRWGEQNDIRKP